MVKPRDGDPVVMGSLPWSRAGCWKQTRLKGLSSESTSQLAVDVCRLVSVAVRRGCWTGRAAGEGQDQGRGWQGRAGQDREADGPRGGEGGVQSGGGLEAKTAGAVSLAVDWRGRRSRGDEQAEEVVIDRAGLGRGGRHP